MQALEKLQPSDTQKCAYNGEGKSVFTIPVLFLANFMLAGGERKWKRARFYPPENNTSPAKRKSNIQSTSQETILKPKTSLWEMHLSAACMGCSPHHYASFLKFQPLNNLNHTIPYQHCEDNTLFFSICRPPICYFFKLFFLYFFQAESSPLM